MLNIRVKNNVWQSVDHNFLEVIECSKIKYFRARQTRDMISMNIFVWVAVKLIKISVPSSHQSESRILNEPPVQFPPLPVLPLKSNVLQTDALTLCYHTSPNHYHLSLRWHRLLQEASDDLDVSPFTLSQLKENPFLKVSICYPL